MVYTSRQLKKKMALVLVLGFILGWTCHVLLGMYMLRGFRNIPYRPTLATVAYAHAEKAQTYKVVVYNLFGRIVARFQGGVALWNRPKLIKRLFVKRFKPSTAVYIYRVYAPSGEYLQGKILVGENPDPGK